MKNSIEGNSSRRILITGGCGFAGRHLLSALSLEENNEIFLIDDFSTGQRPHEWELLKASKTGGTGSISTWILGNSRSFRLIEGNLLRIMSGALEITNDPVPDLPRFDEIYHLASIVGGRKTIEEQPLKVGVDLAIDSLFFYWASRYQREARILYASSSAAYPISAQRESTALALAEEMIDFEKGVLCPDLTYGWSKLTGEYLSRIACIRHGMNVAVVRPFSGYGADQDPDYPVPAIALRVAARQNPVRVWGSGCYARDFIHIDDCIDAMILVCRNFGNGEAFNLGTGTSTTFLELAGLMARLEGHEAEIKGSEGMPTGVANRYCRNEKATRLLGWQPQITLEEGLKRVLAHAHRRIEQGMEVRG